MQCFFFISVHPEYNQIRTGLSFHCLEPAICGFLAKYIGVYLFVFLNTINKEVYALTLKSSTFA